MSTEGYLVYRNSKLMMTSWKALLSSTGLVLLAFTGVVINFFLESLFARNLILCILSGSVLLTSLIISLVLLHAAYLNPPPSHTRLSLIVTYMVYHLMIPLLGKISHSKRLQEMEDPQKYQDELLMNILDENRNTVFATDHGLDQIQSRTEFVQKFPLTHFSTYEKYVDRVANGEDNIMTKAKVVYLSITAGTTGKSKMYPLTNKDLSQYRQNSLALVYNKVKFQGVKLNRDLCPTLTCPTKKSSAGIPVGGFSPARKPKNPNSVAPEVIKKVFNEEATYFIHAIFGLRERNIGIIQGYSSDLMYSFFRCIELNKEKICSAISSGNIDPFPGLDEDVRKELNRFLKPDPARAAEVYHQLNKGNNGLAKRLWQTLTSTNLAKTGSFLHTARTLEKTFLKDVRCGWGLHASTEGFYGICMSLDDLENEIYTFLPLSVFLEFIKEEKMESETPRTYLMSELEVGQSYELVVTNWHGLYRNRLGDVIKVVGHTKNCPKYTFEYRTGEILSLAYDRTPARVFYNALSKLERQWNVSIYNYTTTESTNLHDVTNGELTAKNCYVAFIEFENNEDLSQEDEIQLDQNLREIHEYYSMVRDNFLAPVKIIQVKPRTFDGLRSLMFGGMPNSQFKTPRVIRNKELLEFLWQNRLDE